jgi:hypothetical protein
MLEPQEVVDWKAQFLRLLDEGDQAHPRATAPPGQRGRCKQSDARNLLDRLRKQQKAVLTFLEDLRVDFDNHLAERDLRRASVQQKVSGCFRSLAGAQAFAHIRGYLSTLRKQGLPLLSARPLHPCWAYCPSLTSFGPGLLRLLHCRQGCSCSQCGRAYRRVEISPEIVGVLDTNAES